MTIIRNLCKKIRGEDKMVFKTQLFNLMEVAMDGSALRHKVISNNIANFNTPGYKKSEVSFQGALAQKLASLEEQGNKTLSNEDFRESVIKVHKVQDTSLRNDENNVDVDIESTHLVQNNLYYDGLTRLLSSQIGILRNSINEGRR